MAEFVNLTCPKCGGKLKITKDIDRFSCGFCGNELIVKRSGGVITIAPIVEGLKRVEKGVDKTASELAIARIEGEINSLIQQKNAIHPKSNVWGIIILTFSCVVTFFGLIYGLAEKFQKGSLYCIGPGVGIIVITSIILAFNKKANKKKVEYRKSVDTLIAGKMQELENHRSIVSIR
jgi:ribosomal protein S27AE